MELKSSTSDEGESNTIMLVRDLQCFHYYLPHHFSYYFSPQLKKYTTILISLIYIFLYFKPKF